MPIWEALRPLIHAHDASSIFKFSSQNSYAFIGGKKLVNTYHFKRLTRGNGPVIIKTYIGCGLSHPITIADETKRRAYVSNSKLMKAKVAIEAGVNIIDGTTMWVSVNNLDATFTMKFDNLLTVGGIKITFLTPLNAYALMALNEFNTWDIIYYNNTDTTSTVEYTFKTYKLVQALRLYMVSTYSNNIIGIQSIEVNECKSNNILLQTPHIFSQSLSHTPTLHSISKRRGSTAGGTVVTLYGNFDLSSANYIANVTIGTIVCSIVSVSNNAIACKTGYHGQTTTAKNGIYSIHVYVQPHGYAFDINGLTYQYVDLWSSKTTWGGDVKNMPVAGDLVYIKKGQTVVLDMSPPKLDVLVIEGTLEFDRKDLRLDAHYILVKEGHLIVGTEENPFLEKAVITLHGKPTDTELPMYGAKVLACRRCTLDLHGKPTEITWTRLDRTAPANSTTLYLQQPVDWTVGSYIIIASTDLIKEHVEEVIIVGTDVTKHIIYIDRPLLWKHLGETRDYGNGYTIDMRAEVGLISRNVVVQGDENSYRHEFGATIMMFSPGDESLIGRIENIEIRNAGQAGRLGRYPIHYHMIGVSSIICIRH